MLQDSLSLNHHVRDTMSFVNNHNIWFRKRSLAGWLFQVLEDYPATDLNLHVMQLLFEGGYWSKAVSYISIRMLPSIYLTWKWCEMVTHLVCYLSWWLRDWSSEILGVIATSRLFKQTTCLIIWYNIQVCVYIHICMYWGRGGGICLF